MKAKNRYIKRSRITESKFRQIVKLFCLDLDATKIAQQTGLQRKTINRMLMLFRKRIVSLCQSEANFSGEVEVDESYFGARRVRGKRGRGAKGKTPVVGLLKRDGKVYCQPIKNCTKEELLPVIKGKILEESTVYTDGWKSYDGLVLNGYKHYRVYHSKNEFVRGKSHINGIESFWSYTKRRLAKFNGLSKQYFLLHLKESEFRWNHRNLNTMYKLLLDNFRYSPF
jgi:transposase-like protein